MAPRSPFAPRAAGLAPLALVALLLVGGMAPGATPGAAAGEAMAPLAAGVPMSPAAPVPLGSVDGRVFNATTSPLAGVATNDRLAVDPGTGTGYSLNRNAGNLVAFNLTTGTLERSAQIANPATALPFAIALDRPDHRLFVSVNTSGGYSPYLLAVNATTLSVIANLSDFAGAAAFTPGFVAYDPASGHILVENVTSVDTAVIDPSTDTVLDIVTFPACAGCRPRGIVDVPTAGYAALPNGAASTPTLNTSTDLPGPGLIVPRPGFKAGVGAFDNLSRTVFLTNATATGGLVYFTSAGVYLGNFSGPPRAGAAAFLWSADVLAVAAYNTSYPGAGWEVYTWRASSHALVGHFDNSQMPYWEPGYSFTGLYPDVEAGGTYLVTSGPGNATVRFTVNTTAGTLGVDRAFSGFPNARTAFLTDPASGRYYAVDRDPAGVTAYALAGGSPLWRMDLTYDYATYHALRVAIDPAQGFLYVDFGSTFVDVYATATGSYLSSIFFPSSAGALAVDPVDHLLFVALENGSAGGPTNVSVIATSQNTNALVGTIPWNQSACALAVLPDVGELAAAGCNDTTATSIALFSTTTLGWVGNVSGAPGGASTLLAGPNGTIWWADAAAGTVVAFNVSSQAFGVNWTVGHTVGGLAIDPSDGIGLATSPTAAVVDLVSLSNGTVGATLRLAAPSNGTPAFDAGSSTFLVPLFYTGQRLSVHLVPLPSRPSGLALVPGNTTLSAQWAAATPAPGYPLSNYTVLLAVNATGPWNPVAETPLLQATIGGLVNGVVYYVAIRAASASGTSLPSAIATGTPLGAPYPPTAVHITATSASSLRVNWSPPAATGGAPITLYTIDYATNASGPWITHGVGTALTATLTGLDPATSYDVRVVAWNAVGPGHPSALAHGTTLPVTSPPSSTSGLSGGVVAAVFGGLVAALVGAVTVVVVLARRPPSHAAGGSSLPPGAAADGAAGATPPPHGPD